MREFQGVMFFNSSKDNNQGGPVFQGYQCGWCHSVVHGRMVAKWPRPSQGATAMLCACACGGPTALVILDADGTILKQAPASLQFKPNALWPTSLSKLFEEASSAYAAGAMTACAMVCRKILMACACEQGDADGQGFTH